MLGRYSATSMLAYSRMAGRARLCRLRLGARARPRDRRYDRSLACRACPRHGFCEGTPARGSLARSWADPGGHCPLRTALVDVACAPGRSDRSVRRLYHDPAQSQPQRPLRLRPRHVPLAPPDREHLRQAERVQAIATRYDKTDTSYAATIYLAAPPSSLHDDRQQALVSQSKVTQALVEAEAALKEDPVGPFEWQALGRVYFASREFRAFAGCMGECPALGPARPHYVHSNCAMPLEFSLRPPKPETPVRRLPAGYSLRRGGAKFWRLVRKHLGALLAGPLCLRAARISRGDLALERNTTSAIRQGSCAVVLG